MRKASQPTEPSLGSVYKRPKGDFASRLIDASGLKGVSIGGAQISLKHAGFIVNRGGATSKEVKSLCRLIENTVSRKFGVCLEREIEFLE
jgi:UDP-N-acetylmuramate dehydrogenase